MNKGVELLKNAILEEGLDYYRETGSYAYVAEYEDGGLRIVYNADSAEEARPGVDFEIIAEAWWRNNLGNCYWIIRDMEGKEEEVIGTDFGGNIIDEDDIAAEEE